MFEAIEFYGKGLRALLGLTVTRYWQTRQAAQHRLSYRETLNPKKVVVIGGSYAGTYLAQRLSETLPTGYKVVLVERNTHFNHLFVFPRFGVVPGREHMAFIPYDGMATLGPPGIFEHVHASVTSITPSAVQLSTGGSLEYEYLALATGTWQPPPSKASSTNKSEACAELRTSQEKIAKATSIAVIGGGPVGIQIATDIASFLPGKNVTLIHSRPQLLPNFGPRLHEYTVKILDELGVKVRLGERPQVAQSDIASQRPTTLTFKDGEKANYDLVIKCTGQQPNSELLQTLVPAAISQETRHILVQPTLQLADPADKNTRIFALGDVANTKGPRMARAARCQADVVTANILAMVDGQTPSTHYVPQLWEGIIKLTLGKGANAWYGRDANGKEIIVPGKEKDDDLNVGRAWGSLGSKFEPTASALDPTITRSIGSSAL